MRKATQPIQTFFQITIRGAEITRPNASQLSAFIDAYNRLYTILRIATDPNYDVEILLKRGYRLRSQDKLRVRSFGMSSPFHGDFLLLAFPEAVAALRWLAPIGLDIYKTKRDDPKVRAETAKIEAEADKARAEGRKADAEAQKANIETEKMRHELELSLLEEKSQGNSLTVNADNTELSLDRATKVAEEISKTLFFDKMPGDLEEMMKQYLPQQARIPLSRALTDMTKSSFVIVHVEVVATQISDGDDADRNKE